MNHVDRLTHGARKLFRLKVCGVRQTSDVEATARAGADAIGLNFFPPSCRYLDPTAGTAKDLAAKAGQLGLLRIGVFVNESVDFLSGVAGEVGLDAIQLHGDEPIEMARALIDRGHRIVRAIKLPVNRLTVEIIETAVQPWSAVGAHLLLDADGGRQHGGTGKSLDWAIVRRWSDRFGSNGWTLAGGLAVDTVAQATQAAGAISVDVASGVERQRGIKDRDLIRRFASEFFAVANR